MYIIFCTHAVLLRVPTFFLPAPVFHSFPLRCIDSQSIDCRRRSSFVTFFAVQSCELFVGESPGRLLRLSSYIGLT